MTADMPLPKEVQQQDTMRTMRFRDQHGRPYTTVVSNKTLQPCTVLTPQGWEPPRPMMVPPSKYFTFRDDEVGQTVIAYDAWITDLANAEREYAVRVLEVARRMYGDAAADRIRDRDHGLRMMVGPGPQSSEMVKAMKANHPWALGLRRPDGKKYAQPSWANDLIDGWVHESTFDGGDIDTTVDALAFPLADEDMDSEYADVEDEVDPVDRHTVPAKRSHKRKSPEES